jgi:hypothetical protein
MKTFSSISKAIFSCLFLWGTFCAAQTITGTVRNETTGKPSAGDDVVLLRLDNGMLEETKTKTDSQGAFTLNVQFPDQSHIVRVLHQGVNYDRSVTSANRVDIKVFDSEAKVQGVTGYISIVKVESDGKNFNVTELHGINNLSNPQRTQANPQNFELSLPDKAQMDSVMVAAPGGIQVKAEPKPVAGKGNHYLIGFPLKPGLTRYWVTYHLPYQERIAFHSFIPYPTQMYSVQYPKSMTFSAAEKSGFHPIVDQDGMRVDAIHEAKAGRIPDFQISGVGTLPPESKVVESFHGRTVPGPQQPATPATKMGLAQAQPKPARANSSLNSNAKVAAIAAAVIVALGAFIFLLWRLQAAKQKAARDALKEKLFKLENDRLKGSISPEKYAATKASLNQSLEELVGGK